MYKIEVKDFNSSFQQCYALFAFEDDAITYAENLAEEIDNEILVRKGISKVVWSTARVTTLNLE